MSAENVSGYYEPRANPWQILFAAVAAVLMVMLLFTSAGCSTSGSQPAKSQTATFEDCVFNIMLPPTAKPESVMLEIGTQAQYLESNGTETYTPTATPTMDVKPDTTVTLSRTGATADGLTSIVAAIVNAVKNVKTSPSTENSRPSNDNQTTVKQDSEQPTN